jgi:hypothetical protein
MYVGPATAVDLQAVTPSAIRMLLLMCVGSGIYLSFPVFVSDFFSNGPGLTGCDRQCFSTRTDDSCGVCGGPGGCSILEGEIPCGALLIYQNCMELACLESISSRQARNMSIPVPPLDGTMNRPSDPALVLR